MEVIKTIDEMKRWSNFQNTQNQKIGFVPTMGCLHEGHLSLVERSLRDCDCTVVSIFINPTQFGPAEDLDSYPNTLEEDLIQLQKLGVQAVFLPTSESMYPSGYKSYVQVEEITDHLCGKSRPGFFRGVATIVLKLFNIVSPHTAFFGEKDRQQLEVIKVMVKDFNLDINIVGLPIVREKDGLAKSSRNVYLSDRDRISAAVLSKAIYVAKDLFEGGEVSAKKIRDQICHVIQSDPNTRIDYVDICDPKEFYSINEITGNALLALAVHVGKARLIDNYLFEKKNAKNNVISQVAQSHRNR